MRKNKIYLKFKWKDCPVQQVELKEIHGMRYMCEDKQGNTVTIYEDELIKPLENDQYWKFVEKQKKSVDIPQKSG
jgi:hypothetical protein